jgi:hypothetical protein
MGAFPTVTYQYAPALFPPDFTGAFDRAALTWTGVTLGTFRYVNGGGTQAGFPLNLVPDGVSSVDFIYLVFLTGNPMAITLRTNLYSLSVDFDCVIREIDTAFNSTLPGLGYDTDGIPQLNRFDVQSEALHELGHALGLSHVGAYMRTVHINSRRVWIRSRSAYMILKGAP